MPPIPSLGPQVPDKSLAKLLFFSETPYNPFSFELVKTHHFKIKPSDHLEAQVFFFFCLPWTKAELKAMVEIFPKVTKDPPDLRSNVVFRLLNFVFLTYITFFICLLVKARPNIG